jgi:hypothetical protein
MRRITYLHQRHDTKSVMAPPMRGPQAAPRLPTECVSRSGSIPAYKILTGHKETEHARSSFGGDRSVDHCESSVHEPGATKSSDETSENQHNRRLCCTADGRPDVENRVETEEEHFRVKPGVHFSSKRLERSTSM